MTARLVPVMRHEIDDLVDPIVGSPGSFEIVPIKDMVVDLEFQRNISSASARNVRSIARKFNWRKFSPLIGVKLDDGRVSVIDGQHRATAALSRNIEALPVYLLDCSTQEAAAAFAAINGDVTPMSPQDIYRARLAARDEAAVALQRVLDTAGVKIVSIKEGHRKGETRAIKVLERCYVAYGGDILTLALQAITETGDGNPGLIFGATVRGIAEAIKTKTSWLAKPGALFDAFDTINLRELLHGAQSESIRTKKSVQHIVTRELNARLSEWRGSA